MADSKHKPDVQTRMEAIETRLADVAQSLARLEERINHQKIPVAGQRVVPKRKRAVREYFLEHAPKSQAEKTLTICYYLEKEDGMTSFNVEDINRGYEQAKEKAPTNVNDSAYKCVRHGWLQEAAQKKANLKAWEITETGERAVRAGFRRK